MKYLAGPLVFILSASLLAQNARVRNVSVTTQSKPGFISNSAGTRQPDLGTLLADLFHATSTTRTDVSALQVEKWKAGWQIAWLRSGSQRQSAQVLASSLESNLKEAMPGLINDAQDSRGSMSATFKLYNDLSAIVESVGVLSDMAGSFGRKGESSSLHNDYISLSHIRQDLASYIQLTADSLEPVNRAPHTGAPAYGSVLSASKRAPRGISSH